MKAAKLERAVMNGGDLRKGLKGAMEGDMSHK
jgi:hypothetical protein